jgi:hypothetical protein
MTPEPETSSTHRRGVVRRAARWAFVDRRTGTITVAQRPNISLSIFLASSIVRWLLRPAGRTESMLRAVAAAALVVWAADELVRGSNPFRRFLGLSVLVAAITELVVR